MPPKAQAAAGFSKDEKVLCFHGDLLYEAKILNSKPKDPTEKDSEILYQVHYKGWKNTYVCPFFRL